MANGFGAGGVGANDFEALARQYWNGWGEMMRNAAAAAPAGMAGMPPGMAAASAMPGMPGAAAASAMPGWNEAVGWWSQLAKGGGSGVDAGAASGVNDAIDRFNSQARGWLSQMQQVAAQAAPNASAADITQAWKRALGAQGDNPFADMFRSMRGPGQQGFEQWVEQAAPYLQGFERWQSQSHSMLGQPAFGFAREHQERLQKLAQAQLDHQQHNQAYNALMGEAVQNAFTRFEAKLGERSAPGCQLESARALFDLWIEAAEDAYAEIALSPRFRDAYGAMVNSQMRLRGALQQEIENATGTLGIPTRTEVDAAHRKIVQLERELRRLRDAIEAIGDVGEGDDASGEPVRRSRPQSAPAASRNSGGGVRGRSGASAAAKRAPVATRAAKKTPAAKPAVVTTARKRAPVRSAAKKAVVKKSTVKKAAVKKATASKRPKAAAARPSAARKSAARTAPAKRVTRSTTRTR